MKQTKKFPSSIYWPHFFLLQCLSLTGDTKIGVANNWCFDWTKHEKSSFSELQIYVPSIPEGDYKTIQQGFIIYGANINWFLHSRNSCPASWIKKPEDLTYFKRQQKSNYSLQPRLPHLKYYTKSIFNLQPSTVILLLNSSPFQLIVQAEFRSFNSNLFPNNYFMQEFPKY